MWQAGPGRVFAPTTTAGGMTFNGPALEGNILQVRDAATGALLATASIPGPDWSGVATVGDTLVTGIGSTYNAQPAGVVALTPDGVASCRALVSCLEVADNHATDCVRLEISLSNGHV